MIDINKLGESENQIKNSFFSDQEKYSTTLLTPKKPNELYSSKDFVLSGKKDKKTKSSQEIIIGNVFMNDSIDGNHFYDNEDNNNYLFPNISPGSSLKEDIEIFNVSQMDIKDKSFISEISEFEFLNAMEEHKQKEKNNVEQKKETSVEQKKEDSVKQKKKPMLNKKKKNSAKQKKKGTKKKNPKASLEYT